MHCNEQIQVNHIDINQMHYVIYNKIVEAEIAKMMKGFDKIYNDRNENLVTEEERYGK